MKHLQQNSIEQIKVKQINLNSHRVELRRLLLTSSYWNKHTSNRFHFLKGGENIMKLQKIAIPAFILGVVLVGIVLFMPKYTQTAYAQQLVNQSYQALLTLTPQQQEALTETIQADASTLLQEAKDAKDLQTLTYDQVLSQYPKMKMGLITQSPDGKVQSIDLKSAQFLQFTDPNGNKIVMGIDQNNDLPILVIGSNGNDANTMFRTGNGTNMQGLPELPSGVFIQENTDGSNPLLIYKGKKYAVPQGVTLSPNNKPSIKVEGNDLYINDIKAIPLE